MHSAGRLELAWQQGELRVKGETGTVKRGKVKRDAYRERDYGSQVQRARPGEAGESAGEPECEHCMFMSLSCCLTLRHAPVDELEGYWRAAKSQST